MRCYVDRHTIYIRKQPDANFLLPFEGRVGDELVTAFLCHRNFTDTRTSGVGRIVKSRRQAKDADVAVVVYRDMIERIKAHFGVCICTLITGAAEQGR